MLNGTGSLQLARVCTEKEKLQSTRGEAPTTWEKSIIALGRNEHMIDERGISSLTKRIRTVPMAIDMPNFEIMNFTLQKFVGDLLNCGREHKTYLTSKRHAAGYVLHLSHDVS